MNHFTDDETIDIDMMECEYCGELVPTEDLRRWYHMDLCDDCYADIAGGR